MEQYSKKHTLGAWRERLRVELADTLYEQAKRELRDEPLVSASKAGKQAEDLAQWIVAACLAAVFALVALVELLGQAGGPL